MTVEGRKFSGTAQYIKANRLLHHGTLLYDSNLSEMQNVLSVKRGNVVSKGVKSTQSNVCNLKEFLPVTCTIEHLKDAIANEFLTENTTAYILSPKEICAVKQIQEKVYENWDWIHGKSPDFNIHHSKHFEGVGDIEVFIDVKHGIIADMCLMGDFLYNDDPALLCKKLQGTPFARNELINTLEKIDVNNYILGLQLNTFVDFISDISN